MDGARLQALQYKGHRIAAKNIGLPYDVYRPTGPMNPMAAGNKILSGFLAFFTPHSSPNFVFGKPTDTRDPLVHVGCDATQIQVADIFVGPQGPVAILSMDHIMPPLGVQALRSITVARDEGSSACGQTSYGGTTSVNEVPLMSGWPASILEGGRGKGGVLPGDPGNGTGWEIIFPQWGSDIIIDYGDIITDDLGRRYGVRTAELSHLGWRIVASEMVI